jgi:hypothetical protein
VIVLEEKFLDLSKALDCMDGGEGLHVKASRSRELVSAIDDNALLP